MSEEWQPKLGDVVTLRSDDDFRMTVTGYDKEHDAYGVLWIDSNGSPHGCNLPAKALASVEPEAPDPETQAAIQQAAAVIAQLRERLDQATEMNQTAGKQIFALMDALHRIVPRESWSNDATELAAEAVRRVETMRSEANQQLEHLSARVRELGG